MPTVSAVVVTYNDPESLRKCLAALARQTLKPDEVIVIDNASSPPVVLEDDRGLSVKVFHSEINGGPAGGFADGLEQFLRRGADLAWLMDDDCQPEPSALATLVTDLADGPDQDAGIAIPTLEMEGRRVHWPAWCGVLIPRVIVEAVGLPRRDFVWWVEDTEYLQCRIPAAGFATKRSAARVFSEFPRRGSPKPSWKLYYEARNSTYYRLYVRRHRVVRRMVYILAVRPASIVRTGDRRLAGLWMHARGVWDGIFGRLGLRVPLTSGSTPIGKS